MKTKMIFAYAGRCARLACITVLALLYNACQESIGVGPEYESFEEVFEVGENPPQIEEDTTINETIQETLDGNRMNCCIEQRVQVVIGPEKYLSLDPSTSDIFPGNLLQFLSLANTRPSGIPLKRSGGTVTIDLLNGSKPNAEVQEVSYSSMAEAQNKIIRENNGIQRANFTFQASEVHSHQQMALAMGVNFKTLTQEIKTSLKFNTDQQYNRYLVRLEQIYYTMHFDRVDKDSLFATEVQPTDLIPFIQADNPAVYVSSVSYGRRFFLLIESTQSKQELEIAIKANYNGAIVKGGVEGEVKHLTQSSSTRISAFAQGGDAALALSAVNGGFEALQKFLTEGGAIETGFPLSYKLRSVNTGDELSVPVEVEYLVKECHAIPAATQLWGKIVPTLGSPVGALSNYYNQLNGETSMLFFNLAGDKFVKTDLFDVSKGIMGPYDLTEIHPNFPFSAVGAGDMSWYGERGMHFWDANGLNFVVLDDRTQTLSKIRHIREIGDGANNPFLQSGVGGFSRFRTGPQERLLVFDRAGENYSFLDWSINKWDSFPEGNTRITEKFHVYQEYFKGPFSKINAAVDLEGGSLGSVVLIDHTGTKYSIYDVGKSQYSPVFSLDK